MERKVLPSPTSQDFLDVDTMVSPGHTIYEENSRLLPDKCRATLTPTPYLIQSQSPLSCCSQRKWYGMGALWGGIFPSKTRALFTTLSAVPSLLFRKGLWA